MQKQSFLESLFSSVVWKLAGYIIGFFKHIIIAAAIGLSTQLDIFYMAMAVIGILISTWAGALEFAAMPKLVKAESKENARRFSEIASGIFVIAVGASMVVAILSIVFRDSLTVLAFGFDGERREVLAGAFIWLLPLILLKVPYSVFGAMLRSKRLFALFYQSETLISVVILVCIATAINHPAVLLWSASLGVTAAFLYTGAFSFRHIKFRANLFNPEMMGLIRLVPKLMVLYGTYYIFAMLDRIFASFLPEGSISGLAYALVMVHVVPSMLRIPGSFMTVAAEKSGVKERSETLNDLMSLVILLSAASIAPILLTATDLVSALFERGAFSGRDTATVATSLTAFAFMIAPAFLLKPIDQIYQIEGRIGMMVRRTLIGIVVGAFLNYAAVFILGWGVFGLALATTVSYWIIVLLGFVGLVRIGYRIAAIRHLKWMAWCVVFVLGGSAVFLALPDFGVVGNCLVAPGLIGLAMFFACFLYPTGRETDLLDQVNARIFAFRG